LPVKITKNQPKKNNPYYVCKRGKGKEREKKLTAPHNPSKRGKYEHSVFENLKKRRKRNCGGGRNQERLRRLAAVELKSRRGRCVKNRGKIEKKTGRNVGNPGESLGKKKKVAKYCKRTSANTEKQP